MKIAVLASGSGSNLQALIDRHHSNAEIPIEIALVLSDRPKAQALDRAKLAGIPTSVVQLKNFPNRDLFDREISRVIDKHEVSLIVLAGFMKLLQPGFVRKYRNKLINIHPSLLPSFPGKNAVPLAIEHGVKVSGVTVHFVDEGVDTGPIIAQVVVPVFEFDDEKSLHERIQAEEYKIYPKVLEWFIRDQIRVEGRKVFVDEQDAIKSDQAEMKSEISTMNAKIDRILELLENR